MKFEGKTIDQIKGNIDIKSGVLENALEKFLFEGMYSKEELIDLICFSIKTADLNNQFEYGKSFILKGVVSKYSQYIYACVTHKANCDMVDYIGTAIKISHQLVPLTKVPENTRIYEVIDNSIFWKVVESLRKESLEEPWEFKNHSNPTFAKRNYILGNYVKHTFARLVDEGKVYFHKEEMFINLGLYNAHYEEICIKFKAKNSGNKYTEFEIMTKGNIKEEFELDVERAFYFADTNDIVFDTRLEIDYNFEHILNDEKNYHRLPYIVKSKSQRDQRNALQNAINDALKKLVIDYRIAVPQYYKGTLQLLIPVRFPDCNIPLVLAISKLYNRETRSYYYRGFTCLTYEMAYNNARQIAQQQGSWLKI